MNSIKSILSVVSAVALGFSLVVQAGSATFNLDIKRQQVGTALMELGERAGVQIIFPQDIGTGVETAGIQGEYTVSAALDSLLKGSGLAYEFVSEDSVLVKREGVENAREDSTSSVEKTRNRVIDEVIVTAQKREQSTFDVPMSISALSAGEIEKKGIDDLMDLSFAVPGVMVRQEGPGWQSVFMRGIGNNNGNESMTSVYLDEAPVNTGSGANANFAVPSVFALRTTDIERIEVLYGPQGTLYGAGAVSGTVRFITKDPQLDRFAAKGDVTLSFTKDGDPSQEATAVVNVPVVEDQFGLRLATTLGKQGGWIDFPEGNKQDANNQDLRNIRLKALWQPVDAFNANATVIVNRNESDFGTIVSDEDRVRRFPFLVGLVDLPFRDDSELYNLTMSYELGFADLLSASTYIDQKISAGTIYVAGEETLFPGFASNDYSVIDNDVFSQELRLSSNDERSLSWTVGAFYRDRDSKTDFTGTSEFGGFFLGSFSSSNKITSESWAVFGDAGYSVSDRLEIGGGVRYFEDDREAVNITAGLQDANTFDATTWRTYLSYDVTDEVKAYVNIGTGFRSGGFNLSNIAKLPAYEPETVTSYEVGTKMTLLGGRGNAEIALFYTDYKDMIQRSLFFDPSDPTTIVQLINNVGAAEVKGIDMQLDWLVTDNLAFSLNGTYNDGEITQVDENNPAGAMVSDPLDVVPEYTYSAGVEYHFDWRPDVPGYVRLDYNHRSKVHSVNREITAHIMESDDISLLNARIGAERDRWTFELFGENLLDEDGNMDAFKEWSITPRPRPRTIGIKVGVDFE